MAASLVYRPDYTVKQYRPDMYKLIRFNRGESVSYAERSREEPHESKLAASLSRARSVVCQLAMCNDWQYFFTGTLNPEWHDRDNLNSFRERFTQWIRDMNKRPGYSIKYLLVPERHEKGQWHMHGLISGLPPDALCPFVRGIHPLKLVNSDEGYVNWPGYAKKFGFCSLGVLRDPVRVAFYLQKYITKSVEKSVTAVGGHTYFPSRGLQRAIPFGEIYGRRFELDQLLTHDYDFCSCGFVKSEWHFWLPYVELDGETFNVDLYGSVSPVEASEGCPEWEQMILFGFGGGASGCELNGFGSVS